MSVHRCAVRIPCQEGMVSVCLAALIRKKPLWCPASDPVKELRAFKYFPPVSFTKVLFLWRQTRRPGVQVSPPPQGKHLRAEGVAVSQVVQTPRQLLTHTRPGEHWKDGRMPAAVHFTEGDKHQRTSTSQSATRETFYLSNKSLPPSLLPSLPFTKLSAFTEPFGDI